MLLAIAYLLSGGMISSPQLETVSPGFLNGIWWSFEPSVYELPVLVDTKSPCQADMRIVSGGMLYDGGLGSWNTDSIEHQQKQTCSKWIEKKYPERCEIFDRDKWLKISQKFSRRSMSFCIDTYEWPNKKGAYPWVMVTWPEARSLCERAGKRLCTEDEWTFACEGEEAMPYPYGYTRNSQECNLDNPWKRYSQKVLAQRGSAACSKELTRLWQGRRSGSSPLCSSSFGVEDMNGSVDEWTVGTIKSQYPYTSVLKGGYWSTVRTRCRPATRNHGPGHTFYQQGFRCCSDVSSSLTF